jgi:5-methylcytosine-specific restriction enzyme subunit McrC
MKLKNNKNLYTALEYEVAKNDKGELLKLNPKEVKTLRKINRLYFPNCDGEKGLFNLVSENRVKANQYVGVVQINNSIIQVLPKILTKNDKEDIDKEEKSFIIKNLLYMLSYTKKINIKETEVSKLDEVDNLFEIIIYLFAKNLLELLKKDLVKNYNVKEENLNFLKGKLQIKNHIKKNIFNKAKFFCEYDDFSEDILLNQIFKATVDKVIRFTNSNNNFKLLSYCDLILSGVRRKWITYNMTNHVVFNRLNEQYRDCFNLAKLLLFGNSTNISSKSFDSFSLMFDMNDLFEEFIYEFLRRNKDWFGIKNMQCEKPRKKIFSKPDKFTLKPDITINCDSNNNCELIIDTKYKKLINDESKNYDVKSGDVYQMFAYSKYYECGDIILLYPQYDFKIESKEGNYMFSNFDKDFSLYIRTVNLHRNLLKKAEREDLKKELGSIFITPTNPPTKTLI